MSGTAQQLLSTFSNSIRNSTIKRLRKVPEGAENWAPVDGGMTFADLALHIIECDVALLNCIKTHAMDKNLGEAGAIPIEARAEFDGLIERLREGKAARFQFIAGLSDADMDIVIEADRIRGIEHIPLGGLVLELLDHEVHHRGQLSTYLRVHEAARAASSK